MKKLTAVSLLIFWALVTALLTSGLVFYQNKQQAVEIPPEQQSASVVAPGALLSMREILTHNTAASCWLLVSGKVYDVTTYLDKHPGDASTILPTCGTDATQAYATKGRTSSPKSHSQNATEMLKAYYIGDFGQKPVAQNAATQKPTTATAQPTTSTAKPTTLSTTVTNPSVTLSIQEIAKHSTTDDCWMIVNGNVYNVTSYIPRHPGGVGAIRPYCGRDGTAAFEGLPHSMNAHQMLANYLVGAVGQQTTSRQSNKRQPQRRQRPKKVMTTTMINQLLDQL